LHLHQAGTFTGFDVEEHDLHLRAGAAVEDGPNPIDAMGSATTDEMPFESGDWV
jgi:hypothetical protein